MKAINAMLIVFLLTTVLGVFIRLTTVGFISKDISLGLLAGGVILSIVFHFVFRQEIGKNNLRNVKWAYFYLLLSLSMISWSLFLMRY